MRICVRSRMPMTWPCTTTSSPAWSFRISCSSPIGNVTSWTAISRLPVELGRPVGGDVRGGAPRRPALVVDGDGIEGHVRVGVLDVAVEDGDVSSEAHRPDAGLVQELIELLLELGDVRIGIARADRARDRLLRQVHRVVGAPADAEADDAGRARL